MREGFPLLTTKRIIFANVIHELLWFISGENHIRNLRKYTNIWNPWADDKGNLDTAYGFYWRKFPYVHGYEDGCEMIECHNYDKNFTTDNFDQLERVIQEIKVNPNSRRLLVSAWEPNNAWHSKLPPCHHAFCFNVHGRMLNLHVTMRSTDVGIGLPYNLASYGLLLSMIAQECKLIPNELVISMTDCHIYLNHVDQLQSQVKRQPFQLPQVSIKQKPFFDIGWEDIKLLCYSSHEPIKMEVNV